MAIDDDYSHSAILIGALSRLREIEMLKEQLDAAGKHIHELRKQLQDQTGREIAEKSFGLPEPRPASAWIHGDLLPAPGFASFRKTNTEVIESSMLVANELTEYFRGNTDELERQTKNQLMNEMFCQMQKRGLFRMFQRKMEHETVYVVGIEVAPTAR